MKYKTLFFSKGNRSGTLFFYNLHESQSTWLKQLFILFCIWVSPGLSPSKPKSRSSPSKPIPWPPRRHPTASAEKKNSTRIPGESPALTCRGTIGRRRLAATSRDTGGWRRTDFNFYYFIIIFNQSFYMFSYNYIIYFRMSLTKWANQCNRIGQGTKIFYMFK